MTTKTTPTTTSPCCRAPGWAGEDLGRAASWASVPRLPASIGSPWKRAFQMFGLRSAAHSVCLQQGHRMSQHVGSKEACQSNKRETGRCLCLQDCARQQLRHKDLGPVHCSSCVPCNFGNVRAASLTRSRACLEASSKGTWRMSDWRAGAAPGTKQLLFCLRAQRISVREPLHFWLSCSCLHHPPWVTDHIPPCHTPHSCLLTFLSQVFACCVWRYIGIFLPNCCCLLAWMSWALKTRKLAFEQVNCVLKMNT